MKNLILFCFIFIFPSVFIEAQSGWIEKKSEIGNKISNKYDELYKKIDEALDYIQKIEDSEIRQILTYRYIDGLTWEQTGQSMNYSWETVRKKHDKFMKIIPPNTTLNDLQ